MAKRKKRVVKKTPVKPVPEVESELCSCNGCYDNTQEALNAYYEHLKAYGFKFQWPSSVVFMGIEGRCVLEVFSEDKLAYHLNIFYFCDDGFEIYASLSEVTDDS